MCYRRQFSFGWKHIDVCNAVCKEYSEEADIMFFSDEPLEHYTLHSNQFAIFSSRCSCATHTFQICEESNI